MLQQVVRVLTVSLTLLLLHPDRPASQELHPKQEPVIRIAYGEFPPYAFTDVSGVVRGYSVDLFRMVAEPAGYSVEFVPASNPSEMLAMLEAGTVHATTLLAMTPPRSSIGLFTHPLGSFRNSVFVGAGSGIDTIDDLADHTIGAIRGSFSARGAREVLAHGNIVDIDNLDAQIIRLLDGRIDAAVSASETFLRALRATGVEHRVRQLDTAVSEAERGFLFRRDLSEIRDEFNAQIEILNSSAQLSILNDKWFGEPVSFLDDPVMRIAVIVSATALSMTMAAILISILMYRRATVTFAQHKRNKMLVDALDGINAAVAVFDSNFRAVHCNDGFVAAFPPMVSMIRRNATLSEMIAKSYQNGVTDQQRDAADAQKFADGIIERMQRGEECIRTVRMRDGRVFDAIDFPIGDSMYAAVRVDVTRIHNQMKEIEEQKEQLAILNDKLRNFSSIAAHDLKAPVRRVSMSLGIVREELEAMDVELTEDCSEFLNISECSLKAMTELIDDLLIYAKAESADAVTTSISPNERLDSVEELLDVPGNFHLVIAPDMPDIHVPPAGFDLVVRNLISNAVKHHDREAGCIRMRAHIDGRDAVFEIEDDGPGIAEEYRERIFAPFQRLSAKTPGSGLGLAAVQKTVEAWGGEVSVRSRSSTLKRGSVFEFTAPCAESSETAPPSHLKLVDSAAG